MPLTPEQIGKLICAHTGQRVSLRTDEIHQYFDFARALLAQLEARESTAQNTSAPSETRMDAHPQPLRAELRASAGPDFGDRPLDRLIAAVPFPIFDMTKNVPVRYDNKATSTAVDKHMSGPLAPMCAPLDYGAFEIWWAEEVARNGGVAVGADYRHWALKGYRAALSQPVQADSQCAECNGTRKVDGWPCPICCPTDDGPGKEEK